MINTVFVSYSLIKVLSFLDVKKIDKINHYKLASYLLIINVLFFYLFPFSRGEEIKDFLLMFFLQAICMVPFFLEDRLLLDEKRFYFKKLEHILLKKSLLGVNFYNHLLGRVSYLIVFFLSFGKKVEQIIFNFLENVIIFIPNIFNKFFVGKIQFFCFILCFLIWRFIGST